METFSILETFHLSWEIYGKYRRKLTVGILGVYAVAAAAVFGVSRSISEPYSFYKISAAILAAIIIYAFFMFFYLSFVQNIFRGKGTGAKNFFPAVKQTGNYVLFAGFMFLFVTSIPFIMEKIIKIFHHTMTGINSPVYLTAAAFVIIFIVIAVYSLISFFYTPSLILDGRSFISAMTESADMMQNQKISFFCVLFLLLIFNVLGHITIIGWLFTVPFSVMVLTEIYVQLHSGNGEISQIYEEAKK